MTKSVTFYLFIIVSSRSLFGNKLLWSQWESLDFLRHFVISFCDEGNIINNKLSDNNATARLLGSLKCSLKLLKMNWNTTHIFCNQVWWTVNSYVDKFLPGGHRLLLVTSEVMLKESLLFWKTAIDAYIWAVFSICLPSLQWYSPLWNWKSRQCCMNNQII